MSSEEERLDGSESQIECDHNEEYLTDEVETHDAVRYCFCRRCASSLRMCNGHRFKVNKAVSVIGFKYECIDCGIVVSTPYEGSDFECET